MTETTLLLILKLISGITIGGTLGSFFGVLLYRLPRRQSIITPRSYCNSCKKTLAPRDLVPVFSYFINGGKCRYCSAGIGLNHVFIELSFMAIATFIIFLI